MQWGQRHITADDIMVFAPYNLRVKLLQRTLPANARVGTADKFQGQEAAVSIVSMTTSSEEDLPRHDSGGDRVGEYVVLGRCDRVALNAHT